MMVGATPVAGDMGSPPLQVPPPPIEVNGDLLAVGDIVARAVRGEGGGCDFGTVKVHTTAPGDGRTRWLAIRLDSQCRAVVTAKWEGSLTEGPSHVVEPLLRLLSAASLPIPQELEPSAMSGAGASSLLVAGSKTSEQHVYMYGFGGPGDQLTHKYGRITFSYNGQSATITGAGGSCWGSEHGSWRWVVDRCTTTDANWGPASNVWIHARGNYHCDPPANWPCNISNPDGYYHSLLDDLHGYADGRSQCFYSWSGVVVFGVGREILQGCS